MILAIVGIAVVLAILTAIFVAKSLIVICPPNRVAVISGGKGQVAPDGRKLGYRTLKGLSLIHI